MELMQSLCTCSCLSVCLCAFAVIFEPLGQNEAKFCQKDGFVTVDGIPALCERRQWGRQERPLEYQTFGESEVFIHTPLEPGKPHSWDLSDCRKTASAGVCSQPPDTNLWGKWLYWCSAHKNTSTLGTHSPHALKFSYFYFWFLAIRTLHFLFSHPMPIFVLNLIFVIKAKELKTKVSIFTLPP